MSTATYTDCQHCGRDIRDCAPTLGGPAAQPCPDRIAGAARARAAFDLVADVQRAHFGA